VTGGSFSWPREASHLPFSPSKENTTGAPVIGKGPCVLVVDASFGGSRSLVVALAGGGDAPQPMVSAAITSRALVIVRTYTTGRPQRSIGRRDA
jgi:hypothetical protein